jgi:hypothetical protein
MKTDWEVSRRDLLKQLGVGMACLPILKATKSYAQAKPIPKRCFFHLQTEGYRIPAWLPPNGPLANAKLPDSTSPLEPHKNDLIFVGNLSNPNFPGCDRWGHGSYGQIFTGGTVDTNSGNGKEYWEPLIPSADQVIAQGIAKTAPHLSRPSLPIEVHVGGGGRYPGSARCYWAGPKQPVTPEPDPYKIYNSIFAGRPAGADPAADKLRAERKSLLDVVGADLERFKLRLGTEDRFAIDGHLAAIRDIEKQLTTQAPVGGSCGKWSGNPAAPIDWKAVPNTPQLVTLHHELLIMALKCDVTRVVTEQWGDATGGRIVFDFVPGVPRMGNGYQPLRDWHDLGHRPVRSGVADGDDKAKVDKWTMTKFAELLNMVKAIPEGNPGETMLDHMVILWANHMEDGANHGAQKLPWIIAGKCNGYFKTGHCYANPGKAMNAVLAEICNGMDVKVDYFGDQNIGKPMTELRA